MFVLPKSGFKRTTGREFFNAHKEVKARRANGDAIEMLLDCQLWEPQSAQNEPGHV
jgi:hypothetical protein